MEPEIQDLLARNQQHLRNARAARYPELRSVAAFAEGAISALEDVGSLTREESRVWRDRIQEVLTEKSPAPRRRGRTAPVRPPTGRITRVIPGPLDPAAFLDGGVRVVAVELYEQFGRIHWTICPLPSYEMVLGDDVAALDRDTDGLPEADREHQRDSARLTRLFRMIKPSLSDDVGTAYRFKRGSQTGSFELNEQRGTSDFYPAVPDAASELLFGIARVTVPIQLT